MTGRLLVVEARTAPGFDDLVERGEQRLLDREVLDHRLDDEVAVRELVELRRAGDPAERGGLVVLGGLAALHRLVEGLLERADHLGDLVVAARAEDHVVPGLRADLDDAGRHGAGADDTDPLHRARLRTTGRRGLGLAHDCRRVRLLVGVEAAAGLAAEEAGGHELLEDRCGRVQVVARLVVHRVEDLVRRVQADQVEQRQRAHRVAAAEPHRRVDVLARRVAALVHRHRVVEVAEQQRVGDEAGAVTRGHVGLADACDQRLDVLDDARLGDDGLHDLDQPHDRGGVEPVHAEHAGRPFRRNGDLGHRQRRRVGGEDGVRVADLVQLGEHRLLEVQSFRDRLDDELDVGEVGQRRRGRDPAEQLVPLGLGQLAARDRTCRGVLEVGAAPRDRRLVNLDAHDVEPGSREHLGDARAHRAEADHADLAELARHCSTLLLVRRARDRAVASYPAVVRLVIARCSVAYAGRLTAHLPSATRLLLVKADGSVSIHADGGAYKPLNWMSPPCTLREEDGRWTVTNKAGEQLVITIEEVLHDSSHELGVDPGLLKDGVEAHLQALLAEHCEVLGAGWTLIRREYPTDIGPVDLLCRDADGGTVAVEIKRRGEIDGVEQLTRYLERLDRDPLLRPVRGVFAAQQIKPQARVLANRPRHRLRGPRLRRAARHRARPTPPCSEEPVTRPGVRA